jgi:hypothetical protein
MALIDRASQPLFLCHALAGDLLMAMPALRALGARYGFDRPLICGTEPEHAVLLRATGFTQLRQTLFRTRPAREGETIVIPCEWTFDPRSVADAAEGCDLIVNLIDSNGPAVVDLARMSRLPSVGFFLGADRRLAFEEGGWHVCDRYFALARALLGGRAVLADHAWFPHRADAGSICDQVVSEIGDRRFLALHADTKLYKMWPLQNWAAFLKRLWEEEPATHVALLGYPDIPVETFARDRRLHDCRDLPLTVNYEIVALADQFVGIDSCMLHAADLCRVPSVAILTEDYPPDVYGLRFADGETIVGGNPPQDVAVDAVWAAYCRVRDRNSQVWSRRPRCALSSASM